MSQSLIATITNFLESIGIPVEPTSLDEETFLPGIKIDKGTILVDYDKLKYPGDLLHEAGHVAVMTAEERGSISGNIQEGRPEGQNDEMGAILWSYAALLHLSIKPEVVFHESGYKGDAQWLVENLSKGNYIGLPLLEWMGLTTQKTFPKMKHWIRPADS